MDSNTSIDVGGGILVGHDGSATASAALRTAIRCAPVFGPHIQVVRAWTTATAPPPGGLASGYVPSFDEFAETTLSALEHDVAPIRDEHLGVPISCSVVHGNAAEKLIESSSDVDLIVLGSRGHGGFAGLLLGSVADQVAHHALCRVLLERDLRGSQHGPESLEREQLENALASELKLESPE